MIYQLLQELDCAAVFCLARTDKKWHRFLTMELSQQQMWYRVKQMSLPTACGIGYPKHVLNFLYEDQTCYRWLNVCYDF